MEKQVPSPNTPENTQKVFMSYKNPSMHLILNLILNSVKVRLQTCLNFNVGTPQYSIILFSINTVPGFCCKPPARVPEPPATLQWLPSHSSGEIEAVSRG